MAKILDYEYLNARSAKEKIIYYLSNLEIKSRNLYSYVMLSAEKVIVFGNQRHKYHIRPNGYFHPNQDENNIINSSINKTYEIWTWGAKGNNPQCLKKYKELEDAENELFRHVYQSEYLLDERLSREYYHTLEEAKEKSIEQYAEQNNLDIIVSERILHKQWKIDNTLQNKEEERIILLRIQVEELAKQVSKTFKIVEGETFMETKNRMDIEYGKKIDRKMLRLITRLIRRNYDLN